jgi:hypothetical protein
MPPERRKRVVSLDPTPGGGGGVGSSSSGSQRKLSLSDLGRVSRLPGVPSLLAVKALAGFASAVFHSAFPVFVGTRFALHARGSGMLLSYTGVIAILTQSVLIQWATARADDARVVRACAAVMLLSFLALAGASTVGQLALLLAPLVASATILATVNTAQLTKAAPADLGSIVAIDMSVGSGVRCAPRHALLRMLPRSAHAPRDTRMRPPETRLHAHALHASPAAHPLTRFATPTPPTWRRPAAS